VRDAAAVVFESFHRYLGVAVGECFGYLFTGAWTVLVGAALLTPASRFIRPARFRHFPEQFPPDSPSRGARRHR
jgi:hypothetical protein